MSLQHCIVSSKKQQHSKNDGEMSEGLSIEYSLQGFPAKSRIIRASTQKGEGRGGGARSEEQGATERGGWKQKIKANTAEY